MKLTRILMIFAVCTLLVAGLSCTSYGISGSISYQLTTITEGQGSVSPSEGSFPDGDSVTITALPASGWEFDHWGNQASGTQNPITIIMNSDKAVYAYFTAPTPTPTPTLTPTPSREAVYQGLATAQATMKVTSSVYAHGNSGLTSVDNVSFQLSSVLQNQDVDLGQCVVNYQDARTVVMNISCGDFTGLLKPNEVKQITVDLSGYGLQTYDTFTIEIIPPTGASIQIRRTLPGAFDTVMNLY